MKRSHNGILVLVIAASVWVFDAGAQSGVCELGGGSKLDINIEIPDRGKVIFNNGIGYSSDGISSKDWEHEIKDNLIIKQGNNGYRLIIIESKHITGSGLWGNILIYKCHNNINTVIYSKSFLGGIIVTVGKGGELLLRSREWGVGDPECCPSKERISVIKINSKDEVEQIQSELIQRQKEGA